MCVYLPVHRIALLIVYTKEYTYIYIYIIFDGCGCGASSAKTFRFMFYFSFYTFSSYFFLFIVHLLRALELVAQPSTLIYILSIRHIYILYILLLYFMATFHGNFINVNRQLARSLSLSFSRFNQIHFTSLNRLIIY